MCIHKTKKLLLLKIVLQLIISPEKKIGRDDKRLLERPLNCANLPADVEHINISVLNQQTAATSNKTKSQLRTIAFLLQDFIKSMKFMVASRIKRCHLILVCMIDHSKQWAIIDDLVGGKGGSHAHKTGLKTII